MIRRPPRSTRTDTLFPYTTLFRSEATAVQASGRISPADSGLWNDAQVEAWAPITHFIREAGSLAGMQLAHAGRKASTPAPWDGGGALSVAQGGWRPIVAPSVLAFSEASIEPHAPARAAIDASVQSFAPPAQPAP